MTPEPGRLARYYHQAAAETLRLIPTDAQRVLDLGCADGSFGVTVKDRTGAELWGIVSDEHTTRPASAVTERVLTEDLEREIAQLPDGYFDAVICVDVLERLVEPGAALHKLRTKLKPDGVVVAAVPNFRFLPALGQVLFRKDFPQEDFGPFDRTYLRFFTRRSIVRIFKKAGLRIQRIEGINAWPGPLGVAIAVASLGFFADGRYLHYVCVGSPAAPRRGLLTVFKAGARQAT
ncbi:SAM-dependent methyltransferase [Mycobacterium persicum]|nr:SAM-dependent methyltransferase [Mycobacterium persicum]